MNPSRMRLAVATFVIAFGLVMAGGCTKSESGSAGSTPAPTSAESTSAPLQEFLDASVKTGKATLSSFSDGKPYTFDTEFWVDGNKFRYDLYQDGKLVRSIQSPDGKTAYFVQHADKISEPAVASVERYLLEFSKPAEQAVEDGIDPETGATRMLYKVNKLDDMAGADNAWLTTEIVYLVKDGNVVGVITKGDKPDANGKVNEADLSVSRRIFAEVKVGGPVDPATFELPYPVKPAE